MTYVEKIMHEMNTMNKPQVKAMIALFAALQAFSGRATMTNLQRYGAGSARRVGRWAREDFDFPDFNMRMIAAEGILEHRVVAAFDPSFIAKSGKHTWGIAPFYNSCASKSEKGLEACTLALLDRDEHTAYTVAVAQTPAQMPEEQTRIDFYLSVFARCAERLRPHTRHLVVDGGLTNEKIVSGVKALGFDLVGKLRHDADMRYLYQGAYRGVGRPKQYDGKVFWKEDLSRFEALPSDEPHIQKHTAIVNHKTLKREVRVVVITCQREKKTRHVILFSTDLTLSGLEIIELYQLRFQIEFLFRDAKQYTGFGHAQVRDEKGLGFFFNASMSTLNQMRLQDRRFHTASEGRVVSIMSWKRRKYNEMIIGRLCAECGLDLNTILSHPNYPNARNFGACAA